MLITPIKTRIVTAGSTSLEALIDASVPEFPDQAVLVVTSKIVSLCENRVVMLADATKAELVARQATRYLPKDFTPYNYQFTYTNGVLAASAGIDESNSGGYYVLWPQNPQQTANQLRRYLWQKFGVKRVGVVISDSVSIPSRRGAIGMPLAHSGFAALRSYVGSNDLFGRPFDASVANVAAGLAAAAVVCMGEGAEGTPMAIISQASQVEFCDHDPTSEELSLLRIPMHEDIYGSFFASAPWQHGKGQGEASWV